MANEGHRRDELRGSRSEPRVDPVLAGATEAAAFPDEGIRDFAEGLVRTQGRQSTAIGLAESQLSALRAHLDVVFGHIADELTGAREDAVATVDERVAEATARLHGKLDEIAAGLATTAPHSAVDEDVLARLAVLEQATAERQAALEEKMAERLRRLTEEVAALRADSVMVPDLDAVRTEAGARIDVPGTTDRHINSLGDQVAEAMASVAAISLSLDALAESVRRAEDRDSAASESLEWRITSAVNQLTEGIDAQEAALRAALEARLEQLPTAEALDHLTQRVEAQQAAVRTALEAQLEQLQLGLDRESARAGAAVDRAERAGVDVARIEAENQGLGLAQEDLSRRFDQVIERLEQLRVQDRSALATREQVEEEVATLEEELRQRLDRLAEQVAETAAVTVPEGSDAARLQALEDHAHHSDDEMSELNDLHSALDVGLGTLRSEIATLRNAMRKMAADQVDRSDRSDSRADARPIVDVDQGRSRRKDRKRPASEMAAFLSSTENLAREQQKLKADVAELEQEARLARAAAQKAADPPELKSLRRDVTVLREQLVEQNEVVDTLRKRIEDLPAKPAKSPGRTPVKSAGPAPVAKRAPRRTKG